MKLFLTVILLCACFWVQSLAKQNSRSTRIIGGQLAYAGQFGYAAAINVQTNDSRFFCGGTVISREWILTAAQCVNGGVLFTIHLGSSSLVHQDPNRVTLATSDYVVHQNFNPSTLENDIGVIKLRLAVEYNDYLNRIQFLGDFYVAETTLLMAIGWGQVSDADSGLSTDLKWVEVAAISNEDCQVTYGNQVVDDTICVVGRYNEGSCYGDTGSALLLDIGRGYIMQAGLATFISGNGCESTDPSGYLRIHTYRSWIKNVTNV